MQQNDTNEIVLDILRQKKENMLLAKVEVDKHIL